MDILVMIGWLGAFMLLLAYFLLIHKNLTSRSLAYQILNILGALFLAASNIYVKAFPSFFTNSIWVLIGLYGLFHIAKHRRVKKK